MISLCTANYNKWPYLKTFLDSIKQYESEYVSEIVIVDDCSTDDSCEIIQKRSKINPDISINLIKNTINQWPWPSYDISVRHAKNDFIMIMDSDDFIISSSLEEKVLYLQKNLDCCIVYGNGKMYDDNNDVYITNSLNDTFFNSIFTKPLSEIKEYFETSVSNLYVPWCLIRKSFLLDTIWWFDHAVRSNDRVLNIKIFRIISKKNQIWYSNIPCFAYRIWDSNISKRYDDMEKLMLDVADKYWEVNNKAILISNIYFTIAMNALKNWDRRISFWYYKKSFRYNISIKKIIAFLIAFSIPYSVIQSHIIKKYAQKIYMFITS